MGCKYIPSRSLPFTTHSVPSEIETPPWLNSGWTPWWRDTSRDIREIFPPEGQSGLFVKNSSAPGTRGMTIHPFFCLFHSCLFFPSAWGHQHCSWSGGCLTNKKFDARCLTSTLRSLVCKAMDGPHSDRPRPQTPLTPFMVFVPLTSCIMVHPLPRLSLPSEIIMHVRTNVHHSRLACDQMAQKNWQTNQTTNKPVKTDRLRSSSIPCPCKSHRGVPSKTFPNRTLCQIRKT